ncbi:secreted RxLR effector protein 78-like [Rutidosis leptorrhynchoides]|uniref:secreted RxLR effector protein 78-like n=1 Tax=Rutidosis leptorrhynchoides TaxID=125765 RepID=UPI003A994D02
MDGALIANESFDFLKSNRIKSMIFKVEFEKAFDCLSWEYLDDMMRLIGFGAKWRGWVSSCLKSASISVLINGSPTKEFKLGRGVRQGDPLSPFLFIIAAEGLNWLTKLAVAKGLYNGVEIGNEKNSDFASSICGRYRLFWYLEFGQY